MGGNLAPDGLAKFYAEDLSVSDATAARIAMFMRFSQNVFFIINPRPWARYGECRVYFKPRSQNNLPAFKFGDRWFYDAVENEVYVTSPFLGRRLTLNEVATRYTRYLSGAKTRQWIQRFSESFYEEKTHWD